MGDCIKCQTFAASPAEPGDLPWGLENCPIAPRRADDPAPVCSLISTKPDSECQPAKKRFAANPYLLNLYDRCKLVRKTTATATPATRAKTKRTPEIGLAFGASTRVSCCEVLFDSALVSLAVLANVGAAPSALGKPESMPNSIQMDSGTVMLRSLEHAPGEPTQVTPLAGSMR
jgi:hypothetical protein